MGTTRTQNAWRKFDTPLRRKADVDLSTLPACDEYGMALVPKAEVRSDRLRYLVADHEAHRAEHAR